LQTIYATVALLQHRPALDEVGLRLLGDLRYRAELCRQELDAVHDLLCPLEAEPDPVDLEEVLREGLRPLVPRYPDKRAPVDLTGRAVARAASGRTRMAVGLLLSNAFAVAQHEVTVWAGRLAASAEVALTIADDGPGATPEQLAWLRQPFPTTRDVKFG